MQVSAREDLMFHFVKARSFFFYSSTLMLFLDVVLTYELC